MGTKQEGLKCGKAAKYLGVSSQTLRNWHNQGILVPEIIVESGHRLYSEKQLEEFIRKMEKADN